MAWSSSQRPCCVSAHMQSHMAATMTTVPVVCTQVCTHSPCNTIQHAARPQLNRRTHRRYLLKPMAAESSHQQAGWEAFGPEEDTTVHSLQTDQPTSQPQQSVNIPNTASSFLRNTNLLVPNAAKSQLLTPPARPLMPLDSTETQPQLTARPAPALLSPTAPSTATMSTPNNPYILFPRPAAQSSSPQLLIPQGSPSHQTVKTETDSLHRPGHAANQGEAASPLNPPKSKKQKLKFGTDENLTQAYGGWKVTVEATGPKPPPKPIKTFYVLQMKQYQFSPVLRKAMIDARYMRPTPIQQHAIPAIVKGWDVFAASPTGSGKTGAYLIPLLGMLMKQCREGGPKNIAYPRIVILAPTRELVIQIHEEVNKLVKGGHIKAVALYGGNAMVQQVMSLRGGCDVVVATPGRLLDVLYNRGVVNLGQTWAIAVDEADKMLDLGLEPELARVLTNAQLSESCQTCMFSARMTPELAAVAAKYMRSSALTMTVGNETGASHLVTHRILPVAEEDKFTQLASLLQESIPAEHAAGVRSAAAGLTVIFTNTMAEANKVHEYVTSTLNCSAALLHSSLPQESRDEAMQCFRYGITPILVTTNLAARGVDVPDVHHVINWDMAQDMYDYVQRCGRTGRGARTGTATTLFTPQDAHTAPGVIEVLHSVKQQAPEWLQTLAEAELSKKKQSHNLQPSCNSVEVADEASTQQQGATPPAMRNGKYLQRAAKKLSKLQVQALPWAADLLTPSNRSLLNTSSGKRNNKERNVSGNGASGSSTVGQTGITQVPSDDELLKQWYDIVTRRGKASRAADRQASPDKQEHTSSPTGNEAEAAAVQISVTHTNDTGAQRHHLAEHESHTPSLADSQKGNQGPNPSDGRSVQAPGSGTARSQRLFAAFSD